MANQNVVKSSPNTVEKKATAQAVIPSVDVYENDRELLLVADLPGVTAETLDIHLDLPELRLAADAQSLDGSPLRYQRQFRVGSTIDAARIAAELKDGVLQVHLPKTEAHRQRRIEVRAG